MTISDLEVIIKTAKDLGHGDAMLCLSDGRDGEKSFPAATAKFVDTGTHMALAFTRA